MGHLVWTLINPDFIWLKRYLEVRFVRPIVFPMSAIPIGHDIGYVSHIMWPHIKDFENNHSDNENNYTKIHSTKTAWKTSWEHPRPFPVRWSRSPSGYERFWLWHHEFDKSIRFWIQYKRKILALSHICRSMQLLRVGSKGWPRGWSFNLSSAAISWTVLNIMQAFGLSGCHVTNLFDLSNFLELFPEKIPNDDLFMTRMNFNELGHGRISDKNDLIMIKWLHKNNDSLIMTR